MQAILFFPFELKFATDVWSIERRRNWRGRALVIEYNNIWTHAPIIDINRPASADAQRNWYIQKGKTYNF